MVKRCSSQSSSASRPRRCASLAAGSKMSVTSKKPSGNPTRRSCTPRAGWTRSYTRSSEYRVRVRRRDGVLRPSMASGPLPHRGARGTSSGMRQLTCTGPGTIEWRDVPEPRLQSDVEALVRPLAVARCDIDLFLTSGAIPAREPFALGHECVGEVVALGDAVQGLEIGQRVVVAFQISCGACRS